MYSIRVRASWSWGLNAEGLLSSNMPGKGRPGKGPTHMTSDRKIGGLHLITSDMLGEERVPWGWGPCFASVACC